MIHPPTIPEWARQVHLVANAIDGTPPYLPQQQLTPQQFRRRYAKVRSARGAGEWDVTAYAVEHPTVPVRVYYPYGSHNPYRRLCSTPGQRVKRIAHWSYMT